MKPFDAVHDFLNTWLVERKPEDVISYFAQQSFACADLEAGEKLDRGMAPFRLLMAMQQANQRFGNVSQLGDILTTVPPAHSGARTKLVQHPYQGQFTLYDVREDAAEQFSCVNRLDPTQASPKAAASKSFGKYYGAVFRVGKKDRTEATTLATLWMRDAKNYWRLISYDLDPVWDEYRVPNTAANAPPPAADGVHDGFGRSDRWRHEVPHGVAGEAGSGGGFAVPLRKVRRVPEAQPRIRPT